jgi:hypothetical protein
MDGQANCCLQLSVLSVTAVAEHPPRQPATAAEAHVRATGGNVRYMGKCLFADELEESVKEAIVTRKHTAIDWLIEGDLAHFTGDSTDGGKTYHGYCGYPKPDKLWPMKVSRYDCCDGSVILIGNWRDLEDGFAGVYVFRLSLERSAKRSKTSSGKTKKSVALERRKLPKSKKQ